MREPTEVIPRRQAKRNRGRRRRSANPTLQAQINAALALYAPTRNTPLGATLADVWPVRACRVCGCTDDRACPGGCWWVEADLCSSCAS
jgi:hypothetical protein